MGMGLGMGEILLIFLVALLLFGAKRLPEIGSSLGKGIREFKSSIREIETELKTPETPRRTIQPPAAENTAPKEAREEEPEGQPRKLTTQQD
ncbi:MAG TPA: twin-arginine translocase TatA/TatE family subunit [Longimicrobiales bacterium]|nr:twin-arginine translocase TatA/TatE family subunit [Longimicrobiales bacterium]